MNPIFPCGMTVVNPRRFYNMDASVSVIQKFLAELKRRNVIDSGGLNDKMLINHLSSQKLDTDYIHCSILWVGQTGADCSTDRD